MNKNEVLKIINERPESILKVLENLYHGKCYVVMGSSVLYTVYKTKRGAEGYLKRQSYVSWYDDYTKDMRCASDGLEIFEIKEREIDNYNSKIYWNKILSKNLGNIQYYNSGNNIIYSAEELNVNEETMTYIKDTIKEIENGKGLTIIEDAGEIKEENEKQIINGAESEIDVNIVYNEDKNGIELYFDNKPAKEILTQLKEKCFRWHRTKKCWYAKDTEEKREFIKTFIHSNNKENENNVYDEVETIEEPKINNNIIIDKPSFDNVEIIDTTDKNIIVKCLEPKFNKNGTIEENEESIKEYGSYTILSKVTKIVKLDYNKYKYFCNNLLKDYSFLSKEGGWEEDDRGNLLYYYSVAVVCDKEVLIIDPSGCSYARYCNKLIEDIDGKLSKELSIDINIDNKEYNNAYESIEDTKLYNIDISDKKVLKDNRVIKVDILNGNKYATGKAVKELIKEGVCIDIFKLKNEEIERVVEGLKHNTSILFGTELDKKLDKINFSERLNNELKRALSA